MKKENSKETVKKEVTPKAAKKTINNTEAKETVNDAPVVTKTINITFTEDENRTIRTTAKGEGFSKFEVIGLLQDFSVSLLRENKK